ncbi:gluconokinase [Galbibacter sp. EGI 63066]|uniref:gluconokinase n=1 Tax=Galbibacter sp. EGI 63066 TaxID=2993559 RepID=UPI0022489B81|nr:gluconokinase [Galbibacter sp. EGI 63066]MCX2681385.1 gluconokinase [Galbibacter sp. EGI 63066]
MEKITPQTPTAIVLMGVSGSGKSTIGKLLSSKTSFPFYDGDNFHPQKNIKKMAAGQALNDDDRQGWLQAINTFCVEKLDNNNSCIIACSALKESYRDLLRNGIEEQVTFVYLMGDFELIKKRLADRDSHFMPVSLLKSQFDTLQPPKDALVVDIGHTPEEITTKIIESI